MSEIWKDIKGYKGLYQVSDHGNVKSVERVINSGSNSKRVIGETILKLGLDRAGYPIVGLWKNSKKTTMRVHRIVAIKFIGLIPDGMVINHKDGVKTNNHVSNLEICTRSHNDQHAYDTGLKTAPKGENHYLSKLTKNDVLLIRGLHSIGFKNIDIHRDYYPSVTFSTISDVVNRKSWKHI